MLFIATSFSGATNNGATSASIEKVPCPSFTLNRNNQNANWYAILVCGSGDNGFWRDISDMYLMLKKELRYTVTLRVGNDTWKSGDIYYVAPQNYNNASHYYSLSKNNIIKAINDVKAISDVYDTIFFYYTAHGATDYLDADGDGDPDESGIDMDAATLANKLNAITCELQVIVLQGCKTGSFIDNLITAQTSKRIVITATDSTRSSYSDGDNNLDINTLNGPDDDGNPNNGNKDGSEFSSGFRQAFRDIDNDNRAEGDEDTYPGSSSYSGTPPKGDKDGYVDVKEAFNYANFEDCYSQYWSYMWEFPQLKSSSDVNPSLETIHVPYFWSGWNNPPDKPEKPDGTIVGYTNLSYTFSSRATDPDNDNVRYYFDWGDSTGNWTEFRTPGSYMSASHSWNETGIYNISVIAEDEYGAMSDYWSEPLTITIIDNIPPLVNIERPKKGYLYIADREIMPIPITLIIGPITLEIDAVDYESGINRVEFYIDDELRATDDEEPYEWLWDETVLFKHSIKVVAYDNAGNTASDEINVIIFNI